MKALAPRRLRHWQSVALLATFTQRGHAPGALIGAICSAVILYLLPVFTAVHFLLYGAIGILTCVEIDYLSSLVLPAEQKSIDGLTYYSLAPARDAEERAHSSFEPDKQ